MTSTTLYKLLSQACGLSHREAAEFLEVSLDTAKKWSSGARNCPPGALTDLAALATKIDLAAEEAYAFILDKEKEKGEPPDVIALGLATDDAEAQSLGWPCVGVHEAVLARVVVAGMARGYEFDVVPRGSTTLSAGAADVHDAWYRDQNDDG